MRLLLALVVLSLASLANLKPAGAEEVYACHIGKPSYCYKYGGSRCEQTNKAPNKAAACEKWTSACLDCHAEIPACLGNKRPPSTSPTCSKCSTKWSACMKRIDRRFWPNRGS